MLLGEWCKGAHRQDLGHRRHPAHGTPGADDAGHCGAVCVARVGGAIGRVEGLQHNAGEIGMSGINGRVDHGDPHAASERHLMRGRNGDFG